MLKLFTIIIIIIIIIKHSKG